MQMEVSIFFLLQRNCIVNNARDITSGGTKWCNKFFRVCPRNGEDAGRWVFCWWVNQEDVWTLSFRIFLMLRGEMDSAPMQEATAKVAKRPEYENGS